MKFCLHLKAIFLSFGILLISYSSAFATHDNDFGYKEEKVVVEGYKEFLYVSSLNPRAWKVEFKKTELDNMKFFIHPGDVVIDIGAWGGDTTVKYALVTGDTGKVLAFEPMPPLFGILERNAAQHVNIVPINRAITKIPGTFTLYSDDLSINGGFGASLNETPGYIGNQTHEVIGVNLEQYLDENDHALKQLTFIKIDCEGYDHKILKSISSLVSTHRPVIQMEVLTGFLSDKEWKEYWQTLLSLENYEIYQGSIGDDLTHILNNRITSFNTFLQLPKTRNAADILCVPKEKVIERK